MRATTEDEWLHAIDARQLTHAIREGKIRVIDERHVKRDNNWSSSTNIGLWRRLKRTGLGLWKFDQA